MMRLVTCFLFLLLTFTPLSSAILPDIREFFSSLWQGQEEVQEEVVVEERVKRQGWSNAEDESSEAHIASSSVLPLNSDNTINMDHMPTLSNGHIGFTPYDNAIFLNGLYNGQGGDSHRAEIPAIIMGKISLGSAQLEREWRVRRTYSLNARTGVFMEEIDSNYVYVQHRMYVHQKYNRLFISDIYARAKEHFQTQGGTLYLSYPDVTNSQDITGFTPEHYESDWMMQGQTRQAEVGATTQRVSVFYMQPQETIAVRFIDDPVNVTAVMAIDHLKANAQEEFNVALRMLYRDRDRGPMKLLREHEEAWQKTWDQGKLELEGDDLVVRKLTEFAQYYLLSNVPSFEPYLQPQKIHHLYGVGRQSLGKGRKGKNQQGHVFWDSEMYVLPAVLPFHPAAAKSILRYRSAMLDPAIARAEAEGHKGARYPWESAFSGNDVTPEGTCEGCRDRQIHVGASVAYAIRLYHSLTRDRDYLTSPEYMGCDVSKAIADYYAELAEWRPEDGRYYISDVMGPDDFHDHQSNDAYTQATISLALHYARYIACMCGRPERDEIPDEYIQKALYLKLPFDNIKKIHYQSEQYMDDLDNRTIKQASVILMGYPLNWNMSREIQKNDLDFYEQLLTPATPAMTLSFMTIGWKFVQERAKTLAFFRSSYENYVIQPFKVWNEYPEGMLADGEPSTVNFLPGMGGFLQSIIYGFVGMRIRPEMLEFHDPIPPEGTNLVRLRRLYYLETNFTIEVTAAPRTVTIQVLEVGQYPLVLVRNGTAGRRGEEEPLRQGNVITITSPENGFFIYSTLGTSCDHPRDYIYMPWGYSPWIDSAPRTQATYTLLFTLIVLILTT